MEKLKTYKHIVCVLCVLLTFEIGMLIYMIRPNAAQMWITIAVLIIICVYLAVLSLTLIKELMDVSKNNKKE